MSDLFTWLCAHSDETHQPAEWAKLMGIVVMDPDGWRKPVSITRSNLAYNLPARSFDNAPCDLSEFIARALPSTVGTARP